MATSPVRIRDEDKAQLELLRREVIDATGEKPTQQELIGRAIHFALQHRDQFLDETTWRPLRPAEFRRWMRLVEEDDGFEAVAPSDIDDVVYGR